MTTKKNRKIRDNILASLKKFNTTRKRDIIKGGGRDSTLVKEAQAHLKALGARKPDTRTDGQEATTLDVDADKRVEQARLYAEAEAKNAGKHTSIVVAAGRKAAAEALADEKAKKEKDTPKNYDEANSALLKFINTNNLEIELADIRDNNFRFNIFDNGTISNPGTDGSLYLAGLRNGDIILSYETTDKALIQQKYAFIGKEKFLATLATLKISKISYIKGTSIRSASIKYDLLNKISKRMSLAKKKKTYIR